jgi:hypothetical protein
MPMWLADATNYANYAFTVGEWCVCVGGGGGMVAGSVTAESCRARCTQHSAAAALTVSGWHTDRAQNNTWLLTTVRAWSSQTAVEACRH